MKPQPKQQEQILDGLVENLRIGVLSQVLVSNGRSFDEILHQSSKNADLDFSRYGDTRG